MRYAILTLLLFCPKAIGQFNKDVDAFHDRAKASADALRRAQAAKLNQWQQRSNAAFAEQRRRLAEAYSKRPPLQDYSRVDRSRITTLEEEIKNRNEQLLHEQQTAAARHRDAFEISEQQRLDTFTTAEEIRAKKYDEDKALHLKGEAEYWAALEKMDVRVHADNKTFHRVGTCPLSGLTKEQLSHTVKYSHGRCPLCDPPVAKIDQSLLPQRYPDPGKYTPGKFQPTEYVPPIAPRAELKTPHTFAFGTGEYLERVRAPVRVYDVYFAVVDNGLYKLAWYPHNRMNRDDLKYVGRRNIEKKREQEDMERKIKEGAIGDNT